jgi:ABC-type transport system involved in multi-copper enzyme maturation permease subunit
VTAGQDVKIIKDLGLAAASAIGMLLAVFVGISLVSKEVERRSIYSLLSKPITRPQFILGKYLGLTFTLVVNLAIMAVAYYVVLAYIDWQTPALASQGWEAPAADPRLLKAFALIGVELMLVTALALFFSTFSNAFLSAGLTIAVYVIGHFNTDLKNLSSLGDSPVLIAIGKGLYYTLPNLTLLDVKADVVHAHAVSGQQMLTGILSAGLYIGLLLTASIIVFSRRDFK